MKEKRRVVFAIPWGDRAVVGTTDTFYDGRPEDVAADANDVDYLLAIANRYFPTARLVPSDVLATWAGIRPLLKPPSEGGSASDVSREHTLFEKPGLVMIAGGKLTTYRRMAAEVVNATVKQLDKAPPSKTADRPLPGGAGLVDQASVDALAESLLGDVIKDPAIASNLARTYGARAPSVVERIRQNPALGERLEPELPYLLAQVDVAVEEEQAATIDDVLSRRVPLLLRSRDQGLTAATKVAARMATLLGWTPARQARHVAEYNAVVEMSRRFKAPAVLPRSAQQ
jgi:glycerol-3-phosphate dehydrogenase